MEIHFQRSIHPVGQGAFYTEHFKMNGKTINIVYDCGTLTKINGNSYINSIKGEIHRVFDRNEQIECVFISHFDEDHVNGIVELCDYCDVKQIVIPLITELEWQLLINGIDESVQKLLNWFESSARRKPLVYVVSPNESDQSDNLIYHEFRGGPFERVGPHWELPLYEGVYGSKPFWRYIPFNFSFYSRHIELLNELHRRGLNIDAIRKGDSDTIKRHKAEIADALKAVSGTRNANSMCILSIAAKETEEHYAIPDTIFHLYRPGPWLSSSCLYTGDYDAGRKPNLRELIEQYSGFKRLGALQIPHHGSRHNFDSALVDQLSPQFCFVSCGFQNRNRHPNGSVVRYILQAGIPFIIVNEFPGTARFWNWVLYI